jgi:hypothetical protein
MVADVVRAVVQRILRDKILLGLVIVAFLGVWVGGMTMSDDKAVDQTKANGAIEQAAASAATTDPKLATDFVSWWLTSAMDYNGATAQENHNKAAAWMTAEANQRFQASFWTPEVAQAVASGRLVAALQPTAVQAQAINPDGSVVVGVSGTMMVQAAGQQPTTQPFLAGFLVKQDRDGLRVAGIDPRAGIMPGSGTF